MIYTQKKQTQPNNLADLLKYEAPNSYSRDDVVVAKGQNLQIGSILGQVTKSGEVVAYNPKATDGSENIIGILAINIDTSDSAKSAFIIARHALVSDKNIIWPSGIKEEQIITAKKQLNSLGIIIRKGA